MFCSQLDSHHFLPFIIASGAKEFDSKTILFTLVIHATAPPLSSTTLEMGYSASHVPLNTECNCLPFLLLSDFSLGYELGG